MESNIITSVFLPVALAVIMLGMGMTLTINDFKRLVIFPKAVAIGLVNQLILLPIIGFAIAFSFPLSPELAVGVVIIALCPGGPTSNLISHLSKGDVALSITLTAISSMVTVFTIPIFTNIALDQLMGETQSIPLPVLKTIGQILIITVIPTAIGMFINRRFPRFTQNSIKSVNIASAVLFVVVILGAILKERDHLADSFALAGPATLVLNVVTMLLGFVVARAFALRTAQQMTISIETGIQNGTLAIAIASSPLLLNNPQMAISPAIYSLIMFITSAVIIFVGRRVMGKSGAKPSTDEGA